MSFTFRYVVTGVARSRIGIVRASDSRPSRPQRKRAGPLGGADPSTILARERFLLLEPASHRADQDQARTEQGERPGLRNARRCAAREASRYCTAGGARAVDI